MSEGWKNGRWERFKCPQCGSGRYAEVRVQRPGTGNWYVTPFFQCFECTVMFTDPVLFTRCSSEPQPGAPPVVKGMTCWTEPVKRPVSDGEPDGD